MFGIDIESSYLKNDLGRVLYGNTFAHLPNIAVEIGVLHGYSTVHIGLALKENAKIHGWACHLYAYDLWDDYAYNHGDFNDVSNTIKKYGLEDFVTLRKGDLRKAREDFENSRPVCLLHVDIGNDGDVFEDVINIWDDRLGYGSLIMFEGGSIERDSIEWMTKYNKRHIRPTIEKNKIVNSKYIYGTYEKFPSITLLINRS